MIQEENPEILDTKRITVVDNSERLIPVRHSSIFIERIGDIELKEKCPFEDESRCR